MLDSKTKHNRLVLYMPNDAHARHWCARAYTAIRPARANTGRRGAFATMRTLTFPTAMRAKQDNIHDTMSSSSIDPFSIGEQIRVFGSTRHHGRTATILKVGRKRLTVFFHDKAGGHYVNYRNARLIDAPASRDPPVRHTIVDVRNPSVDDNTTMTEPRSIGELTTLLEQLAITTATAIQEYDARERDLLFHAFVQSLDTHLGGEPRHNTAVAVLEPAPGLVVL
jgi:hypothetical protein